MNVRRFATRGKWYNSNLQLNSSFFLRAKHSIVAFCFVITFALVLCTSPNKHTYNPLTQCINIICKNTYVPCVCVCCVWLCVWAFVLFVHSIQFSAMELIYLLFIAFVARPRSHIRRNFVVFGITIVCSYMIWTNSIGKQAKNDVPCIEATEKGNEKCCKCVCAVRWPEFCLFFFFVRLFRL